MILECKLYDYKQNLRKFEVLFILFIIFRESAIIFYIPLIIFTITIIFLMLKKDFYINISQDKLWKKILFCNGKLSSIIKLDIIVGWTVSVILILIDGIVNLGGAGLFVVFLFIQIPHYINLITSNENRYKLYSFFLFLSIPFIGLLYAIVCSIPLFYLDFRM